MELADFPILKAPKTGLVRIGRSPDPLASPEPLSFDDLDDPHVGNRFDSALGEYGVLYFGSDLRCCFGETLARFRPDPEVLAEIDNDWPDGFMNLGSVPRDWRTRRLIVTVKPPPRAVFVDVEDTTTHQILRSELAPVLTAYGVSDLDVSTMRGPDRRITRAVSQWFWRLAQEQMVPLAGLRYKSRLNSKWEAWAVFETTPLAEISRVPIGLEIKELRSIAKLYNLIIH